MLSILIPTYNYNAFTLVQELHQQLLRSTVLFEIICIDDGSKSELNKSNQEINLLSHSSFIVLNENIGRSAIRNYLSKKAKYNWLLFLDADVKPVGNDLIYNYLSAIHHSGNIFCGGIKYLESDENKKLLRYKYGINYEEIKIEKRKEQPYKFFFTSNFLISKDIFKTIQFEEKLKKYGREDLLFSLNLKNKKHNVVHLENEVYHLGIDDDATFVSKTKQAMENIAFLEQENLVSSKEGNLLKSVNYLKSFDVSKTIGKLTPYFERITIKKASLFYLNCLKVSYLCYLKSER
jgi:glycosyltransferase involved in cell wall biosynthesis